MESTKTLPTILAHVDNSEKVNTLGCTQKKRIITRNKENSGLSLEFLSQLHRNKFQKWLLW